MSLLFDERKREAELMDDPDLDQAEHFAALRGLNRLNWASCSTRIVWQPIRELSRRLEAQRICVLDIGSGAGDVLLGLWSKARRCRLDLELHGVDISERAIQYARERSRAAGAKITYSQIDALEQQLPEGYDVLVSSLFFHHLGENDVVSLFERMAAATRHLLVVNDLRRCCSGFFLAHAAGRLLTRSGVVHTDGPRSVRAAFKPAEIRTLAHRAGLSDVTVGHRWPCRLSCVWWKDRDQRPSP